VFFIAPTLHHILWGIILSYSFIEKFGGRPELDFKDVDDAPRAPTCRFPTLPRASIRAQVGNLLSHCPFRFSKCTLTTRNPVSLKVGHHADIFRPEVFLQMVKQCKAFRALPLCSENRILSINADHDWKIRKFVHLRLLA